MAVLLLILAASHSADAHGIAGNRFFPGTMTFDDPAVADELLVTPSSLKHPLDDTSGFGVVDDRVGWAFARLLTADVSVGIDSGWIHRSGLGFPTQSGFDQTSLTIKRLMYKDDLHETLVSASLSWGIGGSGAQGVGANSPDIIRPGLFIGKGLGDLPESLSWLRPFGIAAAVTLDVPMRHTVVNFGFNPDNNQFGPSVGPAVETLHWGFAIEYSTLYLTSRFKPGQLPKNEPLHQLVPLVEFAFDSPRGQKTIATMNPGLAYVEDVWQLSAEVIVPLNGETGRSLGARAQLLLFLDDLVPSVFGKLLLGR
ncbi:MAG: hypothetical protein JO326_06800 [Acetobacteraceae bacterium]|nr:hypothetical protein [Acetobacteraceae bacterium]